jgi:hypothetical protein
MGFPRWEISSDRAARAKFNVRPTVPIPHPDTVGDLGEFNSDPRNFPVGLIELNPALTRGPTDN